MYFYLIYYRYVHRYVNKYIHANTYTCIYTYISMYTYRISILLVSMVSSPSAQDEENEGTTENGIFALGTVLTTPAYRSNSWYI
jgi:hypothetical protein